MSVVKTVVKGLSSTAMIGGTVGGPLGAELAKRDSLINYQNGLIGNIDAELNKNRIDLKKMEDSVKERDEVVEDHEETISSLKEEAEK